MLLDQKPVLISHQPFLEEKRNSSIVVPIFFNCCTHFLQLPTLFAEMSNFLQNFLIHLCTRVLFSNNFIQSRLSYACQNWNLTQRQFDRCCLLCVFEKCGLRWLSFSKQNEWYSYVISNVWLHELYETSDLSSIIKC